MSSRNETGAQYRVHAKNIGCFGVETIAKIFLVLKVRKTKGLAPLMIDYQSTILYLCNVQYCLGLLCNQDVFSISVCITKWYNYSQTCL